MADAPMSSCLNNLFEDVYSSPLGPIKLQSNATHLLSVKFSDELITSKTNALLQRCIKQFDEYFTGKRQSFDLPLAPPGTSFQQSVWRHLIQIDYGDTRSYSDIAAALGCEGAARAIGSANRANPIAIIIPCHRIIGRNGSLTGYAGGIERKRALLALENLYFNSSQR